MKNLWDDNEAAQYKGDLGLRVYTSRLLGHATSLVLHGGGNTSVKIRERNVVGEEEEILYVKGSGWDLATIEESGFSPVRMAHLLKLAKLESLTDPQMVNELRTQMTKAGAPEPSVETILHAILPYKYVDHTHADAVVTITNTQSGEERIRDVYGDSVVIIPYVMPGFDLARVCAEVFPREKREDTIGMVLMNHGIFSFGDTARDAYDRLIELVTGAEAYLKKRSAWKVSYPAEKIPSPSDREEIAALRREVSDTAGFPVILTSNRDDRSVAFVSRSDLEVISQQGPATPDHVIRTKRVPLIGKDVEAYARAYRGYFEEHAKEARDPKTILDPAPRVILDKDLGVVSVGKTAKDAAVVSEIYGHTIDIILRATALGGHKALPARDIFAVEYWDLEQAKLRKGGTPPVFTGEVGLVTGAASGIGKACVDSLLKRGAAVVALDLNPHVETLFLRPDFLGVRCDVTVGADLEKTFNAVSERFGGLDMLVLNAGIFTKSCPIAELPVDEWRKVMSVNLDANVTIMKLAHPLLKLSPKSGRVVVIGSKNVPAPGPGAAAYSASKAALNQLARVAALEWGKDGIRVNVIHPDAVFDTAIWTDEVLEARARSYGMTVQEYKTKNVLKVEVSSRDVAEMAAEILGPLFSKTTAAQVPVDGGNDRVI